MCRRSWHLSACGGRSPSFRLSRSLTCGEDDFVRIRGASVADSRRGHHASARHPRAELAARDPRLLPLIGESGETRDRWGLRCCLVIDVLPAVVGILLALAIIGFDTRRSGAKTRALIASDQAILASLPAGSAAATQLSARIQVTTTLYATGQVLPRARRPAAIQAALMAVVMIVVLVTTWQRHSHPGDIGFAALFEGFFGTFMWQGISVFRRAHAVSKAPTVVPAAAPDPAPTQTSTISAVVTVEVARPAAEVWAFIEDPASQAMLSEDVLSGVRMPGTPRGVGEVQAFVSQENGRLRGSMLEILEYEPGVRALTRDLRKDLPANVVEMRTATEVQELSPNRARLTHTHVAVLDVADDRVRAGLNDAWQVSVAAHHQGQHERLRRILETRPGSAPPAE